MAQIVVTEAGWVDRRESAFPTLIELSTGELVCAFSVGGGQHVHGGTEWARSADGGRSWRLEGSILAATEDPPSCNSLRLSVTLDGSTVYAYGSRFNDDGSPRFGSREGDAVFCVSSDGCRSWSAPKRVSMPNCPLEISHSICHLESGRMLAPAALLSREDRLGERVIVKLSDDAGRDWSGEATVFCDPNGELGFWEHKFTVLESGHILAVSWAVTLGTYHDRCNHIAISRDQGQSWGPHRDTGINGQTMTALALGGDRLLLVYNRRYENPGIVAALSLLEGSRLEVVDEAPLYRPAGAPTGRAASSGIEGKFDAFEFGYPTVTRLRDESFMATHWCVEEGRCGIRYTRFLVQW